jgi:hypothetical protein
VCKGARPTGDTSAFEKELRNWVSEQLGAIARPDDIRFADNLPKTRSGKIMRRLLRAIARDEEITQDVSTLENPAIIDQLRGVDRASGAPAKASVKQSKPATAKSKAVSQPGARKNASSDSTTGKSATLAARVRAAKKKGRVVKKKKKPVSVSKARTKVAARRTRARAKHK